MGGATAATSVSVAHDAVVQSGVACVVATYLGVVAFGPTNTNSGTSTVPSVAITTQDANNFIIAALGAALGGGAAAAANSGTLRQDVFLVTGAVLDIGLDLVDSTSAGLAALTDSVTIVSNPWTAIGLELRSVGGSASPATAFPRRENPGGRHPHKFGGPIQLRRRALVTSVPSATLYSQAVAGAIALAGALSIQTRRTLAGSITLSGTIAKAVSRILSGSITLGGTLTRLIGRALAGSIALSGIVQRQTQRLLAGTIGLAGTVTKQTNRLLTGSITLSGTLSKARSWLVAGAIALSGILNTLKIAGTGGGGTSPTKHRIAAWLRRRGMR